MSSSVKRPNKLLLAASLPLLFFLLDANPSLFLYNLVLSTIYPTTRRFNRLSGKIIWVTGASSGIGEELVCTLVKAQAQEVILSARRYHKLHQVAQDCRQRAPESHTILTILSFDALNTTATAEAVAIASQKSIQVLILNAGHYQVNPALQTPFQDTHDMMRVNFLAPVQIATSLLLGWKERGYGHIVVVSSIMARGGHSLASSYVASKQALRGYFLSLSTEEYSWLRVDVVCPGAVATDLWKAQHVAADHGPTLSVPRVADLLLTGVVGPHALFYETWISRWDGLLWLFLSTYFPNLFALCIHLLGTARMAIWSKTGEDALHIPKLVLALGETLLWGRPN